MASTPAVLNSWAVLRAENSIPFMGILQSIGILLSLYFMYDVRKRAKTKMGDHELESAPPNKWINLTRYS